MGSALGQYQAQTLLEEPLGTLTLGGVLLLQAPKLDRACVARERDAMRRSVMQSNDSVKQSNVV